MVTAPDAGEHEEQEELASLQVGTQNGAATTRAGWRLVSHQTKKHTLAMLPSGRAPWYLPGELKP